MVSDVSLDNVQASQISQDPNLISQPEPVAPAADAAATTVEPDPANPAQPQDPVQPAPVLDQNLVGQFPDFATFAAMAEQVLDRQLPASPPADPTSAEATPQAIILPSEAPALPPEGWVQTQTTVVPTTDLPVALPPAPPVTEPAPTAVVSDPAAELVAFADPAIDQAPGAASPQPAVADLAQAGEQALDRYIGESGEIAIPATDAAQLSAEAEQALRAAEGLSQSAASQSEGDKQSSDEKSARSAKDSGNGGDRANNDEAKPSAEQDKLKDLDLQNKSMKPWNDAIVTAADLSGMDAEVIAGQVWHESRGNPNERGDNSDGSTDLGLMQIGQKRWEKDVLPTVSRGERSDIEDATGKDAKNLDMKKPLHNVIGGAFELRYWLDRADGDLESALAGYVSGNVNTGANYAWDYANNVKRYAHMVEDGKKLPDNE